MRIGDAFQSKFLDGEDLHRLYPGGLVVTIEAVRPIAATATEDDGSPKVEWALKVRELKRPIKLKKMSATQIGNALGTDEMDEWFGRTVTIFGIQALVFEHMRWFVNAQEQAPAERPSLPINTDLKVLIQQRYAARLPGAQGQPPNQMDMVPVGAEIAARMREAIAKAGTTWDAFLMWLKSYAPGAMAHAFGVDLADLPRYITLHVRTFLDRLAMMGKSPAESVNTRTGEVTPAAQGLAPAPPPSSSAAAPRADAAPAVGRQSPAWGGGFPTPAEDDIPF